MSDPDLPVEPGWPCGAERNPFSPREKVGMREFPRATIERAGQIPGQPPTYSRYVSVKRGDLMSDSYADALALVIEAARDAAVILRRE